MATIEQKIVTLLKASETPLSPSKIAKELRCNPNSVRALISKLVGKGIVTRQFYGHYIINPIHDMGSEKPPRVQNLFVTGVCDVSGKKFRVPRGMKDLIIQLEVDAQIRILFGSKRGKISWSVKAPLGLDLYSLRLCRQVVDAKCLTRGFKDVEWVVKNFELLQDHENVRLEGLKSVTFTGLEGVLEKYYNKSDGFRREVRASVQTPIENIVALARGGLPTFQLIQGVGVITSELRGLTDALKGGNQRQEDVMSLVKAMWESHLKLIDKFSRLQQMFEEFLKRSEKT